MKCLWENCGKEIDDICTHMEEHISEDPDSGCKWEDCPKRNQPVAKSALFTAHVRQHGVSKSFKCLKCDKTFGRLDALNKHTKRHEAGDLEIQKLLDKSWYCGDLKDIGEIKITEMLRDRQLEMNCHRILHQFLDDSKSTDSWTDYL